MDTTLTHATELLTNKLKHPAFHAVMRLNADFASVVAINVASKPPQMVFVDKVVEKVIDRPVDRPVDRVVHVNDPTMGKFCCPFCSQVFSIGVTPTPRTGFGCPRDCVRSKGPHWWNFYAVL